ncbi:hypothetical protein [Escherichia coli]|uniref:hypothetical protein n=1 Tax=Escherichia coli TaxID=562 RepID=UPI0039A6F80D
MRLRLMQTDAHGIRRERAGGYCPPLSSSQRPAEPHPVFFELWLNAKLRHGNTVVLKIRNARGQIKELRILDWSRVEPLVADDGEVFYRITPDRNLRDHGGGDGACPGSDPRPGLTVFFIRL